ncbi:MAG TPA: LysR family transcriptional regulator [Candidatus Dormibacteraeota bacterium]|nr:LysR family transcriptional regulator [Candidatus Dormibacteraeota bacterium]
MDGRSLGNLNFSHIEAFIQAARLGSFSRAAESLDRTQGAVSQSIAALEERYGGPLFDRLGRRLGLTPLGEILLPRAERAVAELRAAGDEIRGLLNAERDTIYIGAFPSVAGRLMPALIGEFVRSHPSVDFLLLEGERDEVVEMVKRGEADVGFVLLPADDPELDVVEIFTEPYLLIVPMSHRLAARHEVAMADVVGEPLVGFGDSSGSWPAIVSAFERTTGRRPERRWTTDDIYTMTGFVRARLGIALIPRLALPMAGELVAIRIVDAPTRTVGYALPRRRFRSPTMLAFVDHARKALLRQISPESLAAECSKYGVSYRSA